MTTKPKKAAPADVTKLMRQVHRAAPGFPRVHLRMSESGLFFAELMRTADQACDAALAGFRDRGESPSIDTFQAACEQFQVSAALSSMGSTAQEAMARLLAMVKARQ